MPFQVPIVHIEVNQGDDYTAADGRVFQWFSPSYPNLAGAKVTLTFGTLQIHTNVFSPIALEWTHEVPASPSPNHTASLEVSREQTLSPEEGMYDYVLSAKLAGGAHVTLATGHLTVSGVPGQLATNP